LGELCDHDTPPAEPGRSSSAEAALRSLFHAAEIAAAADADEDFVPRLVQRWRADLGELRAAGSFDGDGLQLIDALFELAMHASASDPFREVFEKVAECAAAVYGDNWPQCFLSLATTSQRFQSTRYSISATTDVRKSVVELQVLPTSFGPPAFAALGALLAHECICHVAARQDRVDNYSIFAEGFVDWAAEFFFGRWARLIDADTAAAAVECGTALMLSLRMGDNTAAKARRTGWRIAERVSVWLQEEEELTYEEARIAVARLAVELNCAEDRLDHKDLLVSRLARPPYPNRLQRGLMDWLQGRISASQLLVRHVAGWSDE
jgi:hypothetical protein